MLVFALLAGCAYLPSSAPTPDAAVVNTRVAQVMTVYPTTTPLPTEPPTILLPADATEAAPTAEVLPTEEPTPTTTLEPEPTPTVTPDLEGDPAAYLGESTFTDIMDDPLEWPGEANQFTDIDISDGMLKLTGLTIMDGWRINRQAGVNFYADIELTPVHCRLYDRYGLYFRVPNPLVADQGYLFSVTCDGQFALRRWNARYYPSGEMFQVIPWAYSDAIHTGSGQTNHLGVLAQGEMITLFANGVKIGEATDAAYPEGNFGLFVGAQQTQFLTIQADNFRLWELP